MKSSLSQADESTIHYLKIYDLKIYDENLFVAAAGVEPATIGL